MKFTSSVSGTVGGVRFFRGAQDTGTQSGELWTSTGQLLATATFANESASGWQQVNFSTPVTISANTVYVVSYHTTSPYLAYTGNEFSSSVTNGPLQAPAQGTDGNNGVYAYGSTPIFPTSYNGQAPYYWVDVVFSPAAATIPLAPTGLGVAGMTSSSVSLAWAASSGATSYVILRETSGGQSYAQIGTSTTTTFTDSTAAPNTTYSYEVEAVSTAGSEPAHCFGQCDDSCRRNDLQLLGGAGQSERLHRFHLGRRRVGTQVHQRCRRLYHRSPLLQRLASQRRSNRRIVEQHGPASGHRDFHQ